MNMIHLSLKCRTGAACCSRRTHIRLTGKQVSWECYRCKMDGWMDGKRDNPVCSWPLHHGSDPSFITSLDMQERKDFQFAVMYM